MTKQYFKTKEQYLQFRANFAAAANHANAKSTCEPCDEWLDNEGKISYNTGSSRVKGWLQAEHFIFLNLVRGKPYHHGFTPTTNKNKLSNGGNIWQGLDDAVRRLRYAVTSAKDIKQIPQNATSHSGDDFRKFIEPFLGDLPSAIFIEILCSMEEILVEHKNYYTYFGEGAKIAKKMVSEDLKPKNYQEFMQIVEEINDAQEERILSAA